MLKLNIDGEDIEVQGLDVNVYFNEDDGKVWIAAYEMYIAPDGFWDTNTGKTLLSIQTSLSTEEWGEDEWFGLSAQTVPGEFPDEVARFLAPFITSITLDMEVSK